MNNVISRTCEMFTRVLNFAAERPDSFPADTVGREMLSVLEDVISNVNEAITSQTSGLSYVQRASAERMGAREALRERLQAMTRTARAMALDTPGLENLFRLPRKASDSALLQAARAFVADGLSYREQFIRYGMEPTFIEDLQGEIADMERAMSGQNTGRDSHVVATATVEMMVERGLNAVRRLDAVVRNKFRDVPAILVAWESARHVESPQRARRRTNGNGGGTTPEARQTA